MAWQISIVLGGGGGGGAKMKKTAKTGKFMLH